MGLVSIILPSLRLELARQSLLAIERCSGLVQHEVILVSPFELRAPNVRWIQETEPRGNSAAQRQGYMAAQGDYLLHISDDVLPVPGWLDMAVERIDEREQHHFPFVLGLHPARFGFSTVYGHYFANFIAISRRSAEAIGGTFSTDYRAHFADADISLRAWCNGGRCECLQVSTLYYVPLERFFPVARHKQSSLQQDCETFVGKWRTKYGSGWGVTHQDVNIDYPMPRLVDDSFVNPVPPKDAPPRPPQRTHTAPMRRAVSGALARLPPSQLYALSRLIARFRYGVRP